MRRYAPAFIAAMFGSGVLLGGPVQAQPAGTIDIPAPSDDVTVSGPVMLSVDIQGVTVNPAAEGDPTAFHYHALVDVDPATVLQPGQPIPTGQANIIHTADRTLTLADLAPGQHSVVVVLTRTDHVPLSPNVQDRVTFTVGAAGAAAAAGQTGGHGGSSQAPVAAPRVGVGGTLQTDAEVTAPMVLVVALLLVAGSGGAALRLRRR